METASTYFTRRARQERVNAAGAGSAEARSAHLELAFRLVRKATKPALWGGRSEELPEAQPLMGEQKPDPADDVASVLVNALPLPPSGAFEDLLKAVDKSGHSDSWSIARPR